MWAFQEIHGTKEKFELTHIRLHQHFYVFTSFTDRVHSSGSLKQDEAGVALAFAKHETSSPDFFTPEVFAAGRVLRVSALADGCESIYWCVHNFGLSASHMRAIENALGADVERASANPHLVSVSVLGDFSFLSEGEYQRSLDAPNDSTFGSHSLPAPRAWQAKW